MPARARPPSWPVLVLLAALPLSSGCGQREEAPRRTLLLATTTSTQDSGLLDVLTADFERRTGYHVKALAVGSGEAIALGRRGEADVLLVHSPADEEKLVAEGRGAGRRAVMHNDFVLVGPAADPAGVRGRAPGVALARIAAAGAPFVSRADASGTHRKEQALWHAAGATPRGPWYHEAGQGMGETLRIASERDGYTLTDRGTWLALRHGLALEILVEKDPVLFNPYSVIRVVPAAGRPVNEAGARIFADYLVAPETQALIGAFGRERFGEPLFVGDAVPPAHGKERGE